MATLPNQPFPADPRRIVLLNPTKYLGNLLVAGGLIQDYAVHCRRQNREFLLVLDSAFQDLCTKALVDIPVLWYPRQAIRKAGPWRKLGLFVRFLRQLRAFRADLAFNIEEDSLASRLTQLCGARFRLGCSPQRHHYGYEHVLPIAYEQRPERRRHRWYSFQEVFSALGLSENQTPAYIQTYIDQCDIELFQKLAQLGVPTSAALVAVHPAATKHYKQWPESAFIELCKMLIHKGFCPVVLGAGGDESQRCRRIQQAATGTLNLCNQLSLAELAGFFRLCTGMAGNDSGPSHLASAQKVPGVVVFGPSESAIWGPLGSRSQVLRKADLCDPRCSRQACYSDFRCLREITAQEVMNALSDQLLAETAQ